MKNYIYVDYENINNLAKTSGDKLPDIEGKYFLFFGSLQKTVPLPLLAQLKGKDFEVITIQGNGKNALDFHIVYYLAKNEGSPDTRHFVLSKDQGYDPIIDYINKNGKTTVKRIISLSQIAQIDSKDVPIAPSDINNTQEYEKVLKNLLNTPSTKLPKSEKSLKSLVSNLLKVEIESKKIQEKDIQNIINTLYINKKISKNGNRLSYSL